VTIRIVFLLSPFLNYQSAFTFQLNSSPHAALAFHRHSLDLSASFPETHPDRDPLRIISAAQVQ